MKLLNLRVLVALVLVLQIVLVGPMAQQRSYAENTVTENMIHEFAQNTWAYSNLVNSSNGDLYLSHVKNIAEIAVKKWQGGAWNEVTSIKTSATGDTGFSGQSDIATDANNNIYAAFLYYKGSGITSNRGVEYGIYQNGSWSFQTVEGYSDPSGWKNMYNPSIAVDSKGKAHIVYEYNDANDPRKYEIRYATNQSGSWTIKTIVSGASAIDEVKDPQIEVDQNDNIHITYIKEDNQNNVYGNYYYLHKNISDTSFSPAEKLVDAVTDQKDYRYTPFVVDTAGKITFAYYEGNSWASDLDNETFTTYLQTNQSGLWKREVVYTDHNKITYPVKVSNVGSKSILLMYTESKDWPPSQMGFFAMEKDGGTWTKGTTEVSPRLLTSTPSEITYAIDANNQFIVVMLDNDLRKISYLSGTREDFGLITKSNNANLSNLVLSSGAITPGFSEGTLSYTANVANAVATIQVTPTVADTKAIVKVNGTVIPSGTPANVPLNVGSNSITVQVIAEDGKTVKSYTVTVIRAALSNNANLSNLVLSSGAMTPGFSEGTLSYTATVANAVATIQVTPTVADTKAIVKVNGTAIPSGTPANVPLNVGSNLITVQVIAEDGQTVKSYTVTVIREALSNNANLSNLTVNTGSLSPSFVTLNKFYQVSVPYLTDSIRFTPTVDDATANVTVGGLSVASGKESSSIPLVAGSNLIPIIVTAQDGTTSTYMVTVNRNRLPVVTESIFAVDENAKAGTVVGTISASDPDGNALTYKILSGNPNNIFSINAITGQIQVADGSLLDYETTTSYTLVIQVSDGIDTTTANIKINVNDLNDNSPVPVGFTKTIDENLANGTSVGTVTATDADAGSVFSYKITAGNETGAFAIDSSSGEITVADSSQLDYETVKSFTLTVQVSDGKNTAEATVTIYLNNLNDNKPIANDAVFSVNENAANGTVVGIVTASDADGDAITYKIISGNESGAFAIDATTGKITVANSSQLDYETVKDFMLVVQVSDGIHTADARVTIHLTNVNDNSPVANDARFSVAVNAANGTVVGTVTASDADGDALTYTITNGNDDGIFTINETTGEIKVADASRLKTAIHTLSIRVSDGHYSTTVSIIVQVLSIDATLSNLTSSHGDLTPAFQSGTTHYSMMVGDSIKNIKLTPTLTDANATVKINGKLVTSGQESDTIALAVGKNTITIEVKAQNGESIIYTITVTRLKTVVVAVPVNDGGNVTVSDEQVNLVDKNGTLVVELPNSSDKVDTLKFSAAQLETLINRKVMIQVVKKDVQLNIPAANFSKGEDLIISLEKVAKNPKKLPSSDLAVSAVYDFIIKQGNKIIHHFDHDVELVFSTEGYDHPEKLKVYYWNEVKQKWVLVGGTFENGQIKALTNHFSTFAVFHPKDLVKSGSDSPSEKPSSGSETPSKKPTSGLDTPDKKPSSGTGLPDTATNIYNWLLAGILVLLLGVVLLFVQHLRQKDENTQ